MKTAVEQIAIALYEGGYLQGNGDEIQNLLEHHLEMEKQQIENAFEESRLTYPMIGFKHQTFEQYYEQTYGGNK